MDQSVSARIARYARIVGGICFAAGFVGPVILMPHSNLGPLLGLFVTGPVGVAAGMLIGMIVSVPGAGPAELRTLVHWLAGIWLAALLYSLAISVAGISWIALTLQAAILTTAFYLLVGARRVLPPGLRAHRYPAVIAGMLVLASSIFPPVVSAVPGAPAYALFNDPRFDASRQVPLFTVDVNRLVTGWLLVIVLALATGFVVDRLRRGDDA